MNIKSWLIVIVFLGWGFFCWQWYTCGIKGFCIFNPVDIEDEIATAYDPPFTFSKSSFVCIKGKGLQNYIDSLKKLISEGKTVTITGLYDSSESNKSKFGNLGLARANRIKSLLASALDTSKIHIMSKPFGPKMPDSPFIAHYTDIEIDETVEPSDQITEHQDIVGTDKPKIKETPVANTTSNEKAILPVSEVSITFGQNSIRKDPSSEIDIYLAQKAEQLKQNGQKIYITGHTDNTEDEKLGRIRAWVIKSLFLEKGVNSIQLITGSKGSKEPVGSNNTPEGRHKNRRVDIK